MDTENSGTVPPDEDPELTAPIAELADFGEPPKAGFMNRLRRRIDRRVFASEVVDFSWASPTQFFLQFLEMLFTGFGRKKGDD